MPEQRVVEWFYTLLVWMQGIPSCSGSIPYDNAYAKLRDGAHIIERIPETVLAALIELDLYAVSDDQSSHGRFRSDITPSIARATHMYSFLAAQLKQTEDLQEQVRFAFEGLASDRVDAEVTLKAQSFLEKFNGLMVKPSPGVQRALESILRLKVDGLHPTDAEKTLTGGSRAEGKRVPVPNKRLRAEAANEDIIDQQLAAPVRKEARLPPTATTLPIPIDTSKPINAAGAPAMVKRAFKCAREDCAQEALVSSNYCSEACTLTGAKDTLKALLFYRQKAGLHVLNKDFTAGMFLLAGDVLAMKSRAFSMVEGREHIVAGLTRAGYVRGEMDEKSLLISTMPHLTYCVSSDLDGNLKSINEEKKTEYLQLLKMVGGHRIVGYPSLLFSLPNAASVVFGQSPSIIKPSGPPSETDLRHLAKTNLEELFLTSCMRMGLRGAFPLAILLASEVEEELYSLYKTDVGIGNRRELNKKEYRKHHLMLMRNLKFTHNDRLVGLILSGESSVPELLKMTSEELADPSTQELRAARREDQVHASMIESLDAQLERKRREAMSSKEEAWRGSGELIAPLPTSSNSKVAEDSGVVGILKRLSSDEQNMSSEVGKVVPLTHKRSFDAGDEAEESSPSELSTSLASPRAKIAKVESFELKEEDNAFVSFSSQQQANKEKEGITQNVSLESMKQDDEERKPTSHPKPIPMKEMKVSKVPSVLQLLRGSSNNAVVTPSISTSRLEVNEGTGGFPVTSPTSSSSTTAAAAFTPHDGGNNVPMKLINSAGGTEFSITRPSNDAMECVAAITDKCFSRLYILP